MPHSTGLTFGRRQDGSPNAIFDGLDRVVCSFPALHTTSIGGQDIRRGSPYTAETQFANARLFAASPALFEELRKAHRFLRKNGYDMTAINSALNSAQPGCA